jgi:succinate dehydrogenase flavin-adding protein (antitoxin of CptAB toxin-antitoxin module)
MKQTPIGLVIKEVANEKNIKVAKLAELSGKARPTIYQTFGRSEMSDEELGEWSKVLGVTKDHLFSRWKTEEKPDTSNSNYLLEHLTALEDQFKRLLNQLDVKDRQIEKLMDLLGKPKDVAQVKTTRIKPMYPEQETLSLLPEKEALIA